MMFRILVIFCFIILASCGSKGESEPLLLPPGYGKLPQAKDIEDKKAPKSKDDDLKELRELLLK